MPDEKEEIKMELKAIGRVQSRIKKPIPPAAEDIVDPEAQKERARAFHKKVKDNVAEIAIDPGLEDLLEGIEGFSHILVMFWPNHLAPEERSVRKVHPMGRKDIPARGVFATRSPARPNPVLISTVKLVGREGNVLRVMGLDAVDGSPVIDIKPYMARYDGAENTVIPDWMERLHEELEKDDA